MKGKSLFVTGVLTLSLLVSPATSLASSEDSQAFKIVHSNIQINSSFDWEKWTSQNLQQFDIQSFLQQFENKQVTPKPAPEVTPKEQPEKQEKPEQQEVKEEPVSKEQTAPQPEVTEPAQNQPQMNQSVEESEVSAFEQEVVNLTNEERAKQGLPPLTLDKELSAVAGDKSLDMQRNDYFSHNSPTYGSPFDMMKAYGIDYRTAGENIAMGQTSPEQVVEGWMNSAGHRQNIMNPNFTHIGVGYVAEGNYWTQMFIGK